MEQQICKIIDTKMEAANEWICTNVKDIIKNHDKPSPETIRTFEKEAHSWLKWGIGIIIVLGGLTKAGGFAYQTYSNNAFEKSVMTHIELQKEVSKAQDERLVEVERKVAKFLQSN